MKSKFVFVTKIIKNCNNKKRKNNENSVVDLCLFILKPYIRQTRGKIILKRTNIQHNRGNNESFSRVRTILYAYNKKKSTFHVLNSAIHYGKYVM